MFDLVIGLAVAGVVVALLVAPILIAATRETERLGTIVVLTVAGLGSGGITWLAALWLACTLPKKPLRAPAGPWSAATWR
jgi:hypothetical protein